MGITSTTGTSSLSSENATKRIAIVNTWTYNDLTSGETAGTVRIRYQYSNHLGSASLELDDAGEFVSYQEYFPFGETAYTYGTVSTEYRFTGKERDEFTGLYYFGARYYAPWMFRWMNPDPSGPVDGLNVFVYVSNRPVVMVDPDGRNEIGAFDFAAKQQQLTPYAEETAKRWTNPTVSRGPNKALFYIFAVMQTAGGIAQVAMGVIAIVGSEGLLTPVGVFAIAHGADDTWAGIQKLRTGQDVDTYTKKISYATTYAITGSEGFAEFHSTAVDVAAGCVSPDISDFTNLGKFGKFDDFDNFGGLQPEFAGAYSYAVTTEGVIDVAQLGNDLNNISKLGQAGKLGDGLYSMMDNGSGGYSTEGYGNSGGGGKDFSVEDWLNDKVDLPEAKPFIQTPAQRISARTYHSLNKHWYGKSYEYVENLMKKVMEYGDEFTAKNGNKMYLYDDMVVYDDLVAKEGGSFYKLDYYKRQTLIDKFYIKNGGLPDVPLK